MGWRERDWARFDEDERARLWGARRRRRRRGGSIWTRPIPGRYLLLGVVALLLLARGGGLTELRWLDDVLSRGGGGAAAPFALPAGPEVGGPWPGGTVTYFNEAPQHEWALQQAVAAWNGSGAAVRFATAARPAAAVVIRSEPGSCGHGRANVGYSPRSTVTVFRGSDAGCDRFSTARVLAHELGHVLGLEHVGDGCAAMNPSGNLRGSELCAPTEPWQWRCRLLEPADVAAAVRVYGGTAVPAVGPEACDLYPPPGPPGAVRLVRDRSDAARLALAFARPAEAPLPAEVPRGGEPAYVFAYDRGRCAEEPRSPRYRWTAAPGREQLVVQPILGGGRHCLRVWTSDRLGRLSAASSALEVDVG